MTASSRIATPRSALS